MQTPYKRRIEKAKEFSSIVTQWLKKLSMENFVFDATVTGTATPGPFGTDEIFFQFLNIKERVSKRLIKVLRVENCQG